MACYSPFSTAGEVLFYVDSDYIYNPLTLHSQETLNYRSYGAISDGWMLTID
jgi:hypothetical protein